MRFTVCVAMCGAALLGACVSNREATLTMAPMNGEVTGFINKTVEVDGALHRYVAYVPREYTSDRAWPMIVFLHGAGERGSDGLVQSEVGIGTALRRYPGRYPAVVVMPQCPEDQLWHEAVPIIEAAMARTREEYRIDDSRIYLTGLSMGGYGTWMWGATKADVFAALMPICGGGTLDLLGHLLNDATPVPGTLEERVKNLATVPIWAFHGATDSVVPPSESRDMVERVKAVGGDVRYTEFPDTDHDSWTQAYALEDAASWLFAQQKGK